MRLTVAGRALAIAGGILLASGFLFGNDALVVAGALPLIFLAGAAALDPRTSAERTLTTTRAKVGDRVRAVVRLDVPRRRGLVEIHQALPESFALEQGESNFRVVRTGGRDRSVEVAFEFEAAKRGEYELAPLTLRWIDPLGLVEQDPVAVTPPITIEVIPRPSHRAHLRDVRAHATRPMPEADYARFGLATTEFRELRDYSFGDPIKRINWKATARRLSTMNREVPLVNEYEWEGKKTVWLLFDGTAHLEIGDTIKDAREHAAAAALGLAETFVRRGFQVGASAFRARPAEPLFPEAGEGQIGRMRTFLGRLTPASGPSLTESLDHVRGYVTARRPLFILFTRLDPRDDDLFAGLARARAFHGLRLKGPPAVVLDVEPWTLYPERPGVEEAVRERRLAASLAQRRARATGALVLEWDPGATPFQSVLARRGVI